jgi:hypothetical protein
MNYERLSKALKSFAQSEKCKDMRTYFKESHYSDECYKVENITKNLTNSKVCFVYYRNDSKDIVFQNTMAFRGSGIKIIWPEA